MRSEKHCQGFLLSGDISDGIATFSWLKRIRDMSGLPCYFVLGNHDFYGTSINAMRHTMSEMEREYCERSIHYLRPRMDPIWLDSSIALLGVDGWADGRLGSFLQSSVYLRDWDEIDELRYASRSEREQLVQELSDECVFLLEEKLGALSSSVKTAVILMHVPPFREACLWNNKPADDIWAPHFVARHMGDVLMRFFSQNPSLQGIVLCGHTHHRATFQALPNLRVETADAFCPDEAVPLSIPEIEL